MTTRIPRTRIGGAGLILLATALAGGSGYVLMPLVAADLGRVGYAAFAIFWSGLYLAISAMSGIQQEIARATRPRTGNVAVRRRPVARNFAVVVSGMVLVTILGTAPLWVSTVFPREGWILVWPLAVGVSAYIIVAVIGGVLYGLSIWSFIAAMVSIDGVLRLLLVAVVLQFTSDLGVIAWVVAAPFVLTPLLVWPFMRRRVVNLTELDVGYRHLTWNVGRTIVGSSSTGVLVSGFPLLLGATSGDASEAAIGALVLAITLTRAPIVIAVLSLQSYLVIYFRTHAATIGSVLTRILVLISLASLILAALAYWLASPVLVTLVGPAYELESGVLAFLVGSAGLVAALCATGPAVLARSQHMIFTGGWVVAAVTTIVLLLLPGSLEMRAIVALSVGPLLGLLVHISGLWRSVVVGGAHDGAI